MPKVKLTDRGVKNLTTTKVQEEFFDELLPGFVLRVGRGGSKTWMVRYRSNGTHRRLKLGTYPRTSLADARTEARAKLAAAEAGEDPAEAPVAVEPDDETTFRALAAEVFDAQGREWREKTMRERRRILESELLPAWGDRPADSITRRDVVQLVDSIAARAPVMANRCLATVRMIYNVGLDRQFPGLESNPAHRLKGSEESPRERYLDLTEIRAIWNATAWETPVTKGIFRLALLTAQRVGSICAMRWASIDQADVWRIPRELFKGKRAHLVPLPPEALAVLEEMRELTGGEEYVFPGRGTPHASIPNKAMQRIRERVELEPWTVHDFRRSFRTHATRAEKPDHPSDPAGLGIKPAVADAVLGHAERSLGYQRYTGEVERYLLSEKRDALRRWGAFVLAAVKEAGHG